MSVMDLVGRFPMKPGKDKPVAITHGLKATYRGVELTKPGEPVVDTTAKKGIKAKRPNKTIEKIEPVVSAHFGEGSPDPAVLEAEQFNNRWEGSIIADDTGVYEFSIKTENGARLWINNVDDSHALIDAWVSNGPEVREEKKSLFLVGGRAYRLVLDHFKFKEKSSSIEFGGSRRMG
jgi:hypothetical protein